MVVPGSDGTGPEARAWSPFPAGAAFTLIELLVSMTITLVIVVLLVRVFSSASTTWQRSESQVDAYREARGALQLMARDLSGTLQASYSPLSGTNGTLTPAPAVPTLVLEHYPGTTPDPSGGPINEEVYCLTNIPNSGSSSLCAVGYYCQWLPDYLPVSSDGVDRRPRAYALMRQSLNSNDTFTHLQAGAARAGANSTGQPNMLMFSDLFLRKNTLPLPSISQVAAYGWDLRFRIDTDLNDQTQSVPDGNSPPPADHTRPKALLYNADGNTSSPYPPRLPAYVEIRFKALSDLAGQRLEGPNSGVTQSTWADTATGFVPSNMYLQIIQPNYQQFVLRVPLINALPLPTPTP